MIDLGSFYRGDDYMLRVEVQDESGAAVPITGWSFQVTVKLSAMQADSEAVISLDLPPAAGQDAENGIVYVHFPAAKTAKLLPTTYYLDVQRSWNGIVTTIMVAKVKVLPDITQRAG